MVFSEARVSANFSSPSSEKRYAGGFSVHLLAIILVGLSMLLLKPYWSLPHSPFIVELHKIIIIMSTEEDSERKRSHVYGLSTQIYTHERISNSPVPWEYFSDLHCSSVSLRNSMVSEINCKQEEVHFFSFLHSTTKGPANFCNRLSNRIAFNFF